VRFSRFFIDRPVFAVVLSLVVLAAGLISITTLPISEYPEVTPPTISVRAVYPGANPTVLAQTVGTPLEDAINGVEHMLYMSSSATADGVLNLTVTFAIGTNVDLAQVQVQNRVSQALARLPEEVRALGVTSFRRTAATTRCTCATTRRSMFGMSWGDFPARARSSCSAPATTQCASGSIPTRSRRAGSRRATSCKRSASKIFR
jgi:multidrug efflux pump subunit AcrB